MLFFLIHIHWSYNLFCHNLIWVTHVIFYPNNKSVYSIVMLSTFQLTFPNFLGQVGCSGCWFPFPQLRKWPEDAFKNEQLNLFTSFPWGVAILLERHNQPMATRVLDFFFFLGLEDLNPKATLALSPWHVVAWHRGGVGNGEFLFPLNIPALC